MPFNPDEYLAKPIKNVQAFDPNAYLATPIQKQEPERGLLERAKTAGLGAAQQLSFGNLPRLGALAGEAGEALGLIEEKPYEKRKSEYEQLLESEYQKDPWAYGTGSVGGFLGSLALGGAAAKGLGLAGKAASGLGRLGEAAKVGGLMGAIQAPAEKTESLSEELIARGKGALGGAVTGAGFQGIGEGLTKGARVTKNLALRSVGTSKKHINQLIKQDPKGFAGRSAEDLANFAIDKGIVKAGRNTEEMLSNILKQKSETGKKIGSIYKEAVSSVDKTLKSGISLPSGTQKLIDQAFLPKKELYDNFMKKATTSLKGQPGGRQAIKAIENQMINFLDIPKDRLDIQDMQKFKEGLDTIIFDANRVGSAVDAPTKQALNQMRNIIKDQMEQTLNATGKLINKPKIVSKLKKLNQDYKKFSDLHKIAADKYAAEQGNQFFSLTDKMFMAGAGTYGAVPSLMEGDLSGAAKGAALGMGAGLLSRGMRRYGMPIAATAARKIPTVSPATSGLLGAKVSNP